MVFAHFKLTSLTSDGSGGLFWVFFLPTLLASWVATSTCLHYLAEVCVYVWECPSQNSLCSYAWVFPSNWFGFLSASSVILFNESQSRRSLQMLIIRGQTNLVLHYCLWPSTPAFAAFTLSVSLHFNMSILAVTFLLLSVCWAKSPTIPGLHIPALAVASVAQGSPLPRPQSGEALTVCKRAD